MYILMMKIFFARLLDVSLNTVRTMMIVKNNKIMATTIAFFEILIWYYAVRISLETNESTLFIALSYAFGYSSGTLVGTFINDFFISGIYYTKVIIKPINYDEIFKLNKYSFNPLSINKENNKTIINLIIEKRRYKEFFKLVKSLDKDAKIITTDVKIA